MNSRRLLSSMKLPPVGQAHQKQAPQPKARATGLNDSTGGCCAAGFRDGLCRLSVRLGKARAQQNESALPRAADISADAAGSRRRADNGTAPAFISG